MRLVCPNCGAQYEVDDRVIPGNGRDVQCSNCGHTWFQRPAGAEALAEAMQINEQDAARENVTETPPDGGNEQQPKAQEAEPVAEPDQPSAGDEASDAAERVTVEVERAGPVRRTLDEDLQEVLRQEAEREARVRDRERQKIETQEDLGLDEPAAPDQRAVAAQERMARLRGLDAEEETTASGGAGARRDLLPDIEEINSSLTSIGSEEIIDDFAEPVKRGGFARGFVLMLLLAVIAVALYLYAPLISARIPALAVPLETYIGLVDGARGWVDGMVNLALSRLQ